MDIKEKIKILMIVYLISFIPLIFTLNGLVSNQIFYIHLILTNIVIYFCSIKMDSRALKTLIYIIAFQNLFLVIFASTMSPQVMNLYILTKEIFVIGLVAYSFIRFKRDINILDILIIFFICILLYSFSTSDANIKAKLANARQLVLPFVLFYFGMCIKIKDEKIKDIYIVILNVGKFIFVIGFIQFLLGEKVFDFISVNEFYVNKGLGGWISNGKYPVSFIAWDLHQLFDLFIVRFLSIFYESLTAGHFMALCFIISLFSNSDKKNNILTQHFWTLCFLLGVGLTFSKGAYLIVLISIIVKIYKTIQNKKIVISICSFGGIFFIGAVIALWDKVISIQMHIKGFWYNIVSAKLFGGAGLGNVGVYANIFSQNNNSQGESLIGNLIGQFGIIMCIIYILIFCLIIYSNIINTKLDKEIAITLIIGVFIEMFLSESSVAFLSTGLYFVISGLYTNLDKFNFFKLKFPKI